MKRLLCLFLILTLLFVSCASEPETEILTLDDVVSLSDKGMSLLWGDFEKFEHEDVGSGRYIWEFAMAEPEYTLSLQGNSLKEPPAHILLINESGDSIEIRVDDIEAFLAGKSYNEPIPEPESTPEPKPEPDKPAPPVSSVPSGEAASSSGQSQLAQPTYKIEVSPASYNVSAASITVKITNTSQIEGGYGYAHRIERKVSAGWETVPLELVWNDIAIILPAGKTNTETFSMYQDQYDYQPGTYRIVLLDGLGGAYAEFTLD